MKTRFYILFIAVLGWTSCNDSQPKQPDQTDEVKNEVIVLGTIHGQHYTQEEFGIDVLTDLIRQITPDIILTEIPPDRFQTAMDEFQHTDTITESRVTRFPEYVDVIFPLTKEMDFEIIPTAGWTKEMADDRRQKLDAIREDSNRVDDWNKFMEAGKRSDSLIKATGREFDPYWINSDEYDELVEIELGVYNDLFNEELGLGGWDNINEAHYGYISEALDKYKGQGKRILITYGAGHKGWFLRELKKREDVELKTLKELTEPMEKQP